MKLNLGFNWGGYRQLDENKTMETLPITGYIYLSRNAFTRDCPCQRLVAEVSINESHPTEINEHAHYFTKQVKIRRIYDPRTNEKVYWACYISSTSGSPVLVSCRNQIRDEQIPYYLNCATLLGNVDFALDYRPSECGYNKPRQSQFTGVTYKSLPDGRPILKTEYENGRKVRQTRMKLPNDIILEQL